MCRCCVELWWRGGRVEARVNRVRPGKVDRSAVTGRESGYLRGDWIADQIPARSQAGAPSGRGMAWAPRHAATAESCRAGRVSRTCRKVVPGQTAGCGSELDLKPRSGVVGGSALSGLSVCAGVAGSGTSNRLKHLATSASLAVPALRSMRRNSSLGLGGVSVAEITRLVSS